MIVKVKEPQAGERKMLKPHHLLYTYLHLAPDAPQTADLVASGATCIAYETVTDERRFAVVEAHEPGCRPDVSSSGWCNSA